MRNRQKMAGLILKFIANTPLGRLAISDHAMAATDEIKALSNAFDKLRKNTVIETPNWIELDQYLMNTI